MARELEMEDHYTRLGSAGSRLPTAVIGAVGAAVLLTVGSVVHLSRDVSEMQDAHISLRGLGGPRSSCPVPTIGDPGRTAADAREAHGQARAAGGREPAVSLGGQRNGVLLTTPQVTASEGGS